MKYLLLLFLIISFGGCQQALDDLNKSLEETRQKLNKNLTNTNSAYNSNQTNDYGNYKQETSDSEVVEQISRFNSLAEEAEYNKQLEKNKNLKLAQDKKDFEKIVAELTEFKQERIDFYKKLLIKDDDNLTIIDEKYKNSSQIIAALSNEYKILKQKAIKFIELNNKYYLDKYIDFSISPDKNPSFFIFSGYSYRDYNAKKSIDKEFEEYLFNYTYRLIDNNLEPYLTVNDYQSYLKEKYSSYNERQEYKKRQQIELAEEKQRKIEREKSDKEQEEKNKLAREKELKERESVKSSCQNWLQKAYKDAYSLGVGDKIVKIIDGKAGFPYIISGIEKNTFLVKEDMIIKDYIYVQKSDYIPYSALKNAPSPYCYK